MSRVFVYTERDFSSCNPRQGELTYIIDYGENHIGGCNKIQTPDKDIFIQRIREIKSKNNTTLLSRLPPKVKSIEGTITRAPYNLSFLTLASSSQASAGYNSNK